MMMIASIRELDQGRPKADPTRPGSLTRRLRSHRAALTWSRGCRCRCRCQVCSGRRALWSGGRSRMSAWVKETTTMIAGFVKHCNAVLFVNARAGECGQRCFLPVIPALACLADRRDRRSSTQLSSGACVHGFMLQCISIQLAGWGKPTIIDNVRIVVDG
jgi:hypothetical protein